MPRRTPPSPIHLLPAHIATPPRGAPKYTLPNIPPLIPLIDSVGPKLRIHAFTTSTKSSRADNDRAEPARMGRVAVLIRAPERERHQGIVRVNDSSHPGEMAGDGRSEERGKMQPPWLVSRGIDAAGKARNGEIGLAAPPEARVRVRR